MYHRTAAKVKKCCLHLSPPKILLWRSFGSNGGENDRLEVVFPSQMMVTKESDIPKRRGFGDDRECLTAFVDTRSHQLNESGVAQTSRGGGQYKAEGIRKAASLAFDFLRHAFAIIKDKTPLLSESFHITFHLSPNPKTPNATMHFIPLLSLASLALAAPQLKVRTCSSSSLQWTVTGFNTFTASPGPNAVSSISFDFVDNTSGTSSECGRSLPKGTGGSVADPNNFYSCTNSAFQYEWDGTTLSLKETLACGT